MARAATLIRLNVVTVFLNDSASNFFSNTSKISAKMAAGIAPNRISAVLLRSMPSKIISPKPPAPINAANVAVPTINTIAVRIPAIITGIASGNSTFTKRLGIFIPIANAASFNDGSTS